MAFCCSRWTGTAGSADVPVGEYVPRHALPPVLKTLVKGSTFITLKILPTKCLKAWSLSLVAITVIALKRLITRLL